MTILYLEVKYFKKQKRHYPETYYQRCPNPQYTERCMGLYVKTRRYQKECVECMKVHKTIHKHPLLAHVVAKKPIYGEYDILEL